MYTGTVKLSSFIAFLSKARHPPARQRARQLSRGLGLGLSLCLGFCLGLGRLGLLLGLGLGLGGVRFGTFFGRVADAVRRLTGEGGVRVRCSAKGGSPGPPLICSAKGGCVQRRRAVFQTFYSYTIVFLYH